MAPNVLINMLYEGHGAQLSSQVLAEQDIGLEIVLCGKTYLFSVILSKLVSWQPVSNHALLHVAIQLNHVAASQQSRHLCFLSWCCAMW